MENSEIREPAATECDGCGMSGTHLPSQEFCPDCECDHLFCARCAAEAREFTEEFAA
jgi:hypothetical protein